MALQGTIYVNKTMIGYWSAQRVVGEPGEVCTYKCEVGMLASEHRSGSKTEFMLDHHYDNGAISLMSCVLDNANDLLRKESDS